MSTLDERTPPDAEPPTIADVARAVAVSTATVSRCLNNPERVQKTTRMRVLQAVESLGYTPNFSARALSARRTDTIGAVIPTMDNAIFARGLQAVQEALHEEGRTLLVATSQFDPDVEAEQISTLVARGAEGLLLIGHDRAAETTQTLLRRRIPTIVAWAYDANAALPCVGFDNRGAMRALAEAALERGHRDIAIISAETRRNDRARDRVAGVQDAIAEFGPSARLTAVIETQYTIDGGATAFNAALRSDVRPTVVMCGNDVLAVGAIQQAKRLGLSVPRDVSITGFDDIELAALVEPTLATVHVPHRRMGRRAAEELLQNIQTGGEGSRVEITADLRLRASLGPAV